MVGGWEEMSYTILDKHGPNAVLGSGQQLRRRITEVRNEFEKGTAYEQNAFAAIGQLQL